MLKKVILMFAIIQFGGMRAEANISRSVLVGITNSMDAIALADGDLGKAITTNPVVFACDLAGIISRVAILSFVVKWAITNEGLKLKSEENLRFKEKIKELGIMIPIGSAFLFKALSCLIQPPIKPGAE